MWNPTYMRKKPGFAICLLILSACLLTTCDRNRAQTSVPAPASVTTLTPTSFALDQPYPIVTPLNTQSVFAYPEPDLKMTVAAGTVDSFIASLNKTLTAAPTTTPTPTFPVDALPCHAPDLQISARTDGYPTYLQFVAIITNVSQSTCYLEGPPDIKLLDGKGKILDLEYQPYCIGCNRQVPAPTQTAIVQERLFGRIGIGPQEQVGVFLEWVNWCKPFPEGGVMLRLTLPDDSGTVAGPTNAYVGAPCNFPDNRSQFLVGYYFHTKIDL